MSTHRPAGGVWTILGWGKVEFMSTGIEAPDDEAGRGLFVQIPLEVLHDPAVSHAAKITYGRLLLYAGRDGKCNPAHETLAAEVCLGDRQIRSVLSELRGRGWITWKRTRASSDYVITGPIPDRKKTADLDLSDRKEIADLGARDRKKTAGEIGSFPPVRPEENCRQKDLRKEVLKETDTHPRAADLDGHLNQRFDELWNRWPRKEQRDRAFQDWVSFVTEANEAAVMACADRYLGSDDVARNVVKQFYNWLEQQHRDNWGGDWPRQKSHWGAPVVFR
jgi:hypothetical protein